MPLAKLQFKPGINKETTSYSNQGGWNDCDLVRFRFGYPEKIGGWEKYSTNSFLGDSRSLHPWANLQGNKYLGIGTEIKFYIEESQGYNDITPVRRKVVDGNVVFDLDGGAVAFTLSGVVGTTALGSETVANFTPFIVTGVTSTGEIGTSDQEVATIPGIGAVGTVAVVTANQTIIVSDFVDEG